MSERILITGVSGFVGGSLARYYAGRGLDVIGLVRRERANSPVEVRATTFSEEQLAALVAELDPATIIHAAGSASVGASIIDPARDFDAQVLLLQRLLEGVRRSGRTPRVVFLSSAAVYGNPEQLPVSENARLAPISPYGHHKVLAELVAREYAECFEIPTLVVRLFSVFGPLQRRLLLWELFNQFRNHSEVVVEGTGDEARDYIYVDDLAESLLRLLPRIGAKTATVNVAGGKCVTVRELVSRIGQKLKSEKPVIFRGRSIPGNPTRWQADVSLFERLVGEPPAADFDARLSWNLDQWLA